VTPRFEVRFKAINLRNVTSRKLQTSVQDKLQSPFAESDPTQLVGASYGRIGGEGNHSTPGHGYTVTRRRYSSLQDSSWGKFRPSGKFVVGYLAWR